jgi:site-specific DNA-methyltransferase (adenine-specific)
MMAYRFLVLDRLLKPTGSLYLHCDPAASPYLKIMLDGVFGKELFQERSNLEEGARAQRQDLKNLRATHEVILYFGKTVCALSTSPK